MPRYYNTKKTPLSLPLRDGRSMSVPSKSWVELDHDMAGSEGVARALSKGFLVRPKVEAKKAPVSSLVKKVVQEAPIKAKAKAKAKKVQETPKVLPKDEPVAEAEEEAEPFEVSKRTKRRSS